MNNSSNFSFDNSQKNIDKSFKKVFECLFYMKKSFNSEDIVVFLNYYYYANKNTIELSNRIREFEENIHLDDKDHSNELYNYNKKLFDIIYELTMYYMEAIMLTNEVTEEKWKNYLKMMEDLDKTNHLDDKRELELWKNLIPMKDDELNEIFNKINEISISINKWKSLNNSGVLNE